MKLSILTTVTNPDERQDKWREALENYCNFADEVIVVDGTISGPLIEHKNPKVKFVGMAWLEEWSWPELPKHLNYGKQFCTGDWILKLDIDQFMDTSKENRRQFYKMIESANKDTEAFTLQKHNFVADMKYFKKSGNPILFRNFPAFGFGFIEDFPKGDLCIPMRITVDDPEVPTGVSLKYKRSGFVYWNFSYAFKDQETSKRLIWRNVRAYRTYFDRDDWGKDEDSAFEKFLRDLDKHVSLAKTCVKIHELPVEIRKAVEELKPEQLGYDAWGRIKR